MTAALEILEKEGPSGVTVQSVTRRAGSSVGSFYARFGGKDDLMEYLGGRVWDEVLERWNEAIGARSWSEMHLGEIASGAVAVLLDVARSRAPQLRAVDRLGGAAGSFEALRERLLSDVEALLLQRRAEIVHQDPELAVRLALRAVVGVVDADLAVHGEPVSSELLEQECRALLMTYLTGAAGPGEPQVDFFDVWG